MRPACVWGRGCLPLFKISLLIFIFSDLFSFLGCGSSLVVRAVSCIIFPAICVDGDYRARPTLDSILSWVCSLAFKHTAWWGGSQNWVKRGCCKIWMVFGTKFKEKVPVFGGKSFWQGQKRKIAGFLPKINVELRMRWLSHAVKRRASAGATRVKCEKWCVGRTGYMYSPTAWLGSRKAGAVWSWGGGDNLCKGPRRKST